jgi:DNA-binding response OmpR family regulator
MRKIKLLLVDDEVDITSIMKACLERHGFEVDTFNDPDKAFVHFKPKHYDRIVLDVRMPGKCGFELAKLI